MLGFERRFMDVVTGAIDFEGFFDDCPEDAVALGLVLVQDDGFGGWVPV